MKLDTTKVLSLVLIIIFLLIIISLFTSRPSAMKEDMVVDVSDLNQMVGFDAESLLATGDTLRTGAQTEHLSRIDIRQERRQAEIAPNDIANVNREAIARSRANAVEMRNKAEADLDKNTTALLDSIRRVRAKQEAEGRR